jgi:hypothetical protein
MPLFRLPAASAVKLPARKKGLEPLLPLKEKANCPVNEEIEYPEIVTVALAEDCGKSAEAAVIVTVPPGGGVAGAV